MARTVKELMEELEVGGQTTINARQVIEVIHEGETERDEERIQGMLTFAKNTLMLYLGKVFDDYFEEASHDDQVQLLGHTREERLADFIQFAYHSNEDAQALHPTSEEKKQLKTGKMTTCRVNADIMLDLG